MAHPMTKPMTHLLLRGCLGVCLAAGCAANDPDPLAASPAADRSAAKPAADLLVATPAAYLPVENVAGVAPAAPATTRLASVDPGGIPTSADLAIAISDGVTTVAPGGSLTYTITAVNAGPDNVIGAVVSDTFPAALTCTWTCVGVAGGSCTAAGAGNIANAVSLPVGGATIYTASCAVSPFASGTLSNTATISPPGPVIDPVPGNNSATDTDTITPQGANVTGSKTVAGDFTQGGTVTYTITLSNDAGGVQGDNPGHELTDVLPAGLTLVSASATSGTAIATVGTNTVTWDGSIAAGSDVTLTITATINAAEGAVVSNQAAFAFDSDGNGTNDSSGITDAFVCAEPNREPIPGN
jgi:uncharacterized repeat protein (TIGR01451 family)